MREHHLNKKVIVAVANTIISDSRVMKCAETLKKNSANVQLLGVSNKFVTSKVDDVPMTLLREIKEVKILKNVFRKYRSLAKLSFLIIFLSATLLFFEISISIDDHFDNIKIQSYLIVGSIAIISFIFLSYTQAWKQILLLCGSYIVQLGYKAAAHSMGRELKKYRDSIVHAHDIIALIAAVNAKKTNREMIIIWDAHEIYAELSYKSKSESIFIDRAILESASYINYFITINSSIAAYYAEHYPGLPSASVIMNAGRRAVRARQQIDYIRTTANISHDQKILLFQGGLSENRGIDQLLNAARELPNTWSLVFMGDGNKVREIFQSMKKLNQQRETNRPAIILIPPVPLPELTRWTASATLGAIPYENSSLNHFFCTPNKLWEYPIAGVPVIATCLPEMKKIIKKHKIGFLLPTEFDQNDILEILNKITEEELEILRQNCYKFNDIENWEKYESILLAIYSDAQLPRFFV